jgi:hypothetical protein
VVDSGLVTTAATRLFPKEHFATSAITLRIVNTHFMVFSVKGLFDKGLLELVVTYHNMVIMFCDLIVLALKVRI